MDGLIMLLVKCFCLLCSLLVYVRGYDIQCNFRKNSEVGIISGFSGSDEFNDFLNRCGDEDIEIIRYYECYVGQLSLPVEKIIKNYPSVKMIIWDCNGLCRYTHKDCNEDYFPIIRRCSTGKSPLDTVKFTLI